MAKTDLAETPAGTELFDVQDKVFPDIKAEEGETAFTFMHTVPYEGSVGLVNLLTTTRVLRKGFDTSLVLYGPGVLMASGTRGFPKVGDEAFPGHMAINNALRRPGGLPHGRGDALPSPRRARRCAHRVARPRLPAQHLDGVAGP